MKWHWKSWLDLTVSLRAWITPFPANTFPNKAAANVPNMLRKPPFCSFASFLIVSPKPDYSGGLTISMISFISLLEKISAAISDR